MAPKIKTIYRCSNCKARYPKWQGRCTQCQTWDSLVEEVAVPAAGVSRGKPGLVVSFADVSGGDVDKIPTGIGEFDRVVGGGLSRGSLTLLGGEPGIGKSTLVLQVADRVSQATKQAVLYVSGEESAGQIKDRITRLGLAPEHFSYLGAQDAATIAATIADLRPPLAIVDSIQTVRAEGLGGESGSVGQIRSATATLVDVGKATNTAILIIGHITKAGAVAGPKTLEHLVDTVVYLEGDATQTYRLLRTVKNRFGATSELGVFEMISGGLREVSNPSAMFLAGRGKAMPGSIVTPVIIGTRVFLAEIQCLVSWSRFGYPQRKAVGYDFNRLQQIDAVLSKRLNIRLGKQDIHVKVAGGLRITDPGADLAVALAVISAQRERALDVGLAACGEVGLGGEVRPVPRQEQRTSEALKMGFTTIIVPKPTGSVQLPPQCTAVASIADAVRELWGG